VRIVGVQSENTAAMAKSVAAKRIVAIDNVPTLADGLAGQVDDAALDIGLHALDEILTVTEDEIGRAIVWLAERQDVRAEGAGAVGVAALLAGRLRELPGPAAVVISGGNIDSARFEQLRDRFIL
jgi:threonine dehydratase